MATLISRLSMALCAGLSVARGAAVPTFVSLALAGCPLNHSSTMAMSASTSSSSSGGSSGSSGPSRSTSSDRSEAPSSGIHGAIVRRQLEFLHGMSPEEAKAQLLQYGHDGQVSLGVVTDSGGGQTFRKECGVNKVCETSGGSGISLHDNITLYLNPVLTIAPPP